MSAIRSTLEHDGLLRRYDADDGMPPEGAFLPCSFWLVECLSGQGRIDEARAVYDRVRRAATDVGLFPEQVDLRTGAALGNFPLVFTHLSHIHAALALEAASGARERADERAAVRHQDRAPHHHALGTGPGRSQS